MSESLQKYFRLLYDSLRFPIQVVNKEGKIVYVNELFTIQWGYTLSEIKEYNVFNDNALKRIGAQQIIKDAITQQKYATFDNYVDSLLINSDNATPLLRTSIFPILNNDEVLAVLLHEDQTEQVLAEEEIKKARDTGNEAERLKDTFLTVLSHELRTPLNIILGYSTIIKENLRDKFTAEERVYLDNLYSGSSRLFKSITQMLEFAQIEAGNYKMSIGSYDLCELVHNCVAVHKKNANEKKLDIKVHYPKKKIFVEMDLQCAETSINNLLENAIKFTRHGFIDVEISILEERGLATCKVKDTGIGISSQYLDHLYQPFSQEDLNIGRTFEGNGLGLALSKRYIEKMGGSILVDSIKGVGTTFTVTLPLSKNQTQAPATTVSKENFELNNILMFDDSGETHDLIKVFLGSEYEFEVHKFREYKAKMIDDRSYSLIIIDIPKNLWDQSLEMVKEIKDNDPLKRPVLVLSSEFMHDKIAQFYQAGADKFLVKPFAKIDLLTAIENIVA
ncbi:response regulator [bacterium BMS3Abin03]|nr:response regulator [bacterium BMS3Abin03]MCG6959890.1 response regulator [bacterium BMS3Abin03]